MVALTVVRRSSSIVDRSPRARVLTTLSIMGPFMVRPAAAAALVSEAAPSRCRGSVDRGIAGKLSLGRSFGLMPANRGIVSTGLYRVVRHPIYLGYLITHVGFFAADPTTWNAVILIATDLALMCARGLRGADAATGPFLPGLPAGRAVEGVAGHLLNHGTPTPNSQGDRVELGESRPTSGCGAFLLMASKGVRWELAGGSWGLINQATVAPRCVSVASQNSSTSGCSSSTPWTIPRCTPFPLP